MTTGYEFWDAIEKMHGYMDALGRSQAVGMYTTAERKALRGKLPYKKGVYVLYESGKPMYVGRSDKLADRLLDHGRPSSRSETASFAFNLARGQYPGADTMSRENLQEDGQFQRLFDGAKERVRKMEVRGVQVASPIEQTILEVYLHLKLGTPFNSFENH